MKKFKNRFLDLAFKIITDIILVSLAYYFVLSAESSFEIDKLIVKYSAMTYDIFILFGAYLISFVFFGIYKIMWRYSAIYDLTLLIIASIFADAVYILIAAVLPSITKKVMFSLLFAAITTLFMIFSRILIKFFSLIKNNGLEQIKILAIIGAGNAGISVIKNLVPRYKMGFKKIYLFDDDPLKLNKTTAGIKVVGTIDDLPRFSKELNIDEIIIAIPSATPEQMNRIVDNCLKSRCEFQTLPMFKEIDKINPKDYLHYLRKVNVNDLLGRDEIKIHDDKIFDMINNKVVLVTGGGGSIGSELCRQISVLKPNKLIILDIYENNAYNIQQELKNKLGNTLNLVVEIASIRDVEKVDYIFNKYRPQIVFHAAAHKHVPLMEDNPEEAVKNNSFGTYNVTHACDKYNVEKFILISSDKAVNPTNVMGATKRICEMITENIARKSKTIFAAVRFGNVLGSNGSVIPLFQNQIENGGPVTVTDKRIIRYFMTIPEAVSLVLEANRLAKGGEVFVLDMGKPVSIDDFARKLIKLSGFEPDVDIKIEYTGLRPGEKLYEELILKKENCFATENPKIFIEQLSEISDEYIENGMEILRNAIKNNDNILIKNAIKQMVQTYNPNNIINIDNKVDAMEKERLYEMTKDYNAIIQKNKQVI